MCKWNPTVLVLEDEPIVNFFFENILVSHGFRVLLAASAKEALEQFRRQQEQIDVLVADLTIPDGSGINVATQCAQQSAALRIIITSGTPHRGWKDSDGIAFRLLVSNGAVFLQKPFSATVLLNAVRDALELAKEFHHALPVCT